ncbi:hypothetical protein A2U01_0068075, partial [Trifolium medium]|nr:hypothetical protein [Trifolium medium]
GKEEQRSSREKEGELVSEEQEESLRNRRAKVRELDSIIVSDSEEGRMSLPPFPNSFHSFSFGFCERFT